MENTIHQINNYKSRYDLRDLFLVLNIDQEILDERLEELYSIALKSKESIKLFKKRRNKKNKDLCQKYGKLRKTKIEEFHRLIIDTKLINSVDELREHDFFDNLIDKLGIAKTANRLHAKSLKMTFQIIQKNETMKRNLNNELKDLNISYKQAINLVKSVIDSDENSYFEACRTIEKNFLNLPFVYHQTDTEEALLGCLRSEKYLINVHEDFNLIHNRFDFPEIYLIKVAISKAIN